MDIIINPKYKKLIDEINDLREKSSKLIQDHDFLVFHTCKNIKSIYMSKVGVLEFKVYEFHLKYLRLKRKVELYQSKINRQEKIDENEIEEILNKELLEYQERIKKLKAEVEKSLENVNSEQHSEEDSKEIKRIYRKMIKKLHPDLNKDLKTEDKAMFIKLVSSYELGDLETLKNIEILYEDIASDDELKNLSNETFEELEFRKSYLTKLINNIKNEMNIIKKKFPYNKKDFIKNDEEIAKKKEELNKDFEAYKKAYSDLEKRLEELKNKSKGMK